MLPFHEWKRQQRLKDTKDGVILVRERCWYYAAYGNYCNKVRAAQH